MAKSKDPGSANCWWRCGATCCLGMENGLISPENRLAVFIKSLVNISFLYDSAMPLLGICPRAMRLTFTQKPYVNTYWSSLHSHYGGKILQMSFNGPGCVDWPVVQLQDGEAMNRTNCWNVPQHVRLHGIRPSAGGLAPDDSACRRPGKATL